MEANWDYDIRFCQLSLIFWFKLPSLHGSTFEDLYLASSWEDGQDWFFLRNRGTLFLNLCPSPERYIPLLPRTVACLQEALFHREEMPEKPPRAPSREDRRGSDGDSSKEGWCGKYRGGPSGIALGWCYPYASEGAFCVHCPSPKDRGS